MLMIGATGSAIPGYPTARAFFARWVGEGGYHDLDLDEVADLRLDLNRDLMELAGGYMTVFNLGTIEHVWNAHNAWANAMRAVEVGGHFLSISPIGRPDHAVHMTSHDAIRAFTSKNGFVIIEDRVRPWRSRGENLWMVARKERHIERLEDFEPAWQVYSRGKKGVIR